MYSMTKFQIKSHNHMTGAIRYGMEDLTLDELLEWISSHWDVFIHRDSETDRLHDLCLEAARLTEENAYDDAAQDFIPSYYEARKNLLSTKNIIQTINDCCNDDSISIEEIL